MIAPENPSQNQTLSLVDASDLSALTIEQAHSLMGRNGWLRLDSLMSLSSDVAEVLARHEGGLGFGMLNSVSEETEEFLAGHKGELDIRFLKELKSRALATKLAGQPSWSEGQLLHISDAAAEGLVTRAGTLHLDMKALHNLSPHARTLLETHSGLYPTVQPPAEQRQGPIPKTNALLGSSPVWVQVLLALALPVLLVLAGFAILVYSFFFVTFELNNGTLVTKYTLASLWWPIVRSLWPYFVTSWVLHVVGKTLLRLSVPRS
jgi:hypothetical protein